MSKVRYCVRLKPGIHTSDKVEFNTVDFVLTFNKVERVALALYTVATKSTVSATKLNVSATKSTATNCRIHVVADLLSKLAKKLNVSATKLKVYGNIDFVADLLPVSATVDFQQSRPC